MEIIADCCGAGGAYRRLVTLLTNGQIKLRKHIVSVNFTVPCDYNEVSFSGREGGILTNQFFSEEESEWRDKYGSFEDNCETYHETCLGDTNVQVSMQIVRKGLIGEHSFRRTKEPESIEKL